MMINKIADNQASHLSEKDLARIHSIHVGAVMIS